jgi:hypothetical protein
VKEHGKARSACNLLLSRRACIIEDGTCMKQVVNQFPDLPAPSAYHNYKSCAAASWVGTNGVLKTCLLEYTDVIANSLLLVLCYTLSNPCDVPDFLESTLTPVY